MRKLEGAEETSKTDVVVAVSCGRRPKTSFGGSGIRFGSERTYMVSANLGADLSYRNLGFDKSASSPGFDKPEPGLTGALFMLGSGVRGTWYCWLCVSFIVLDSDTVFYDFIENEPQVSGQRCKNSVIGPEVSGRPVYASPIY